MPLQRSGAISASDINTEISNTTYNPGKSPTATLSLNDADARSLAAVPSGTIAYSDFLGTFQMYSAPDYYYPSVYGYDPNVGWGAISSPNVSGQAINRIAYNGYQGRFEVFIESGSSLGQSWFTYITLGGNTLYTGSASYGFSTNPGVKSYWLWYGSNILSGYYYAYVGGKII